MNWFKCDDSGNVVVDMNNVLLTINNTSIPQIKQNQADILQAIQNITASGGGGLNADQLNQILTILTTIYSSLDFEVTGILNAGETSITITDENIKEDTSMTVFTSIYGVSPLTIVTVDGSVTLTFPPQTDNMGVRVSFKRPVDWDNISGGSAQQPYTVTIDGVEIDNDLNLITVNTSSGEIVSTLPYICDSSSIIVYNNEIHLLGGYNNKQAHYRWTGTDWVNVSTLPYEFYYGSAVVYNNELHILGGNVTNGCATNHYKWNGSEWVNVSALPYEFYGGRVVVCNNEIHILGNNYDDGYGKKTKHYKWNGSEWVNVSALLYKFDGGSAVVYNNEIHILGGIDNNTSHYKWNGSEWVSVSTLPYGFYCGSAVVLNNEIHLLGGNISNGCATNHYKWNGSEWVNVSALPYEFYDDSAVVLNNEIHLLGCATDTETIHVKLISDNSITYKKIN